jgi:hypothetical protein
LGCSGTILKEISLGKTVGIIDLTRELGTRGSAEIRDQEKCCRKILRVSVRKSGDAETVLLMMTKTPT